VGAVTGIAISIGVVIYLTKRARQRRRLAAAQSAAQVPNFPQPQPPPPTQPMYQTAGTPWAQPTQPLSNSSRIPSYYADNSSAANMISWQNQQQQPPSEFSQQPSTMAHSEYNSTYGDSSDYHAKPWAATAASTPRLGGVHTPWTEGSDASESRLGDKSSTGLGRQNTKARYLTATQREEVSWEAKRREANKVWARAEWEVRIRLRIRVRLRALLPLPPPQSMVVAQDGPQMTLGPLIPPYQE
jgi:hypothetical protein